MYSSLLLLSVLAVAQAIYLDDQFSGGFSTELTVDNFDSEIKSAVDSGKTMMVRWIASAGWGWWRKQAPSWNTITRRFADHKDVVFGDINLSAQQVKGKHNPGAGGWPTIKYFNKETGYEGAPYEKKTDKSMCDELGDDEYMEEVSCVNVENWDVLYVLFLYIYIYVCSMCVKLPILHLAL